MTNMPAPRPRPWLALVFLGLLVQTMKGYGGDQQGGYGGYGGGLNS